MSWRKWNIRAELEGVEVKPYVKPKINLDVSCGERDFDFRGLWNPAPFDALKRCLPLMSKQV